VCGVELRGIDERRAREIERESRRIKEPRSPRRRLPSIGRGHGALVAEAQDHGIEIQTGTSYSERTAGVCDDPSRGTVEAGFVVNAAGCTRTRSPGTSIRAQLSHPAIQGLVFVFRRASRSRCGRTSTGAGSEKPVSGRSLHDHGRWAHQDRPDRLSRACGASSMAGSAVQASEFWSFWRSHAHCF